VHWWPEGYSGKGGTGSRGSQSGMGVNPAAVRQHTRCFSVPGQFGAIALTDYVCSFVRKVGPKHGLTDANVVIVAGTLCLHYSS
jgi:hypothetical protein